ncbi:Fluconazole resistance protein 1 [Pleurostoma richardsiae]|uniref:Fluconazole resistance protein 1 n=1 Tax=Pleurostoma richardsiae TaxID=41990 RepID=A0AA38VNC8_9PEZI|nr:Fluconazole resistance protein 1 [Pleurostoma richardsiae]
MASQEPRSSSSSVTATEPGRDLESQGASQSAKHSRISHFRLVIDQAGVTPEVLNHTWQGQGTEESPYIVEFLPSDPRNPFQFPKWKKWFITILQAIATLAVAFVSTAYSGGVFEVIYQFNISREVAILGISLFVLGFAIGPLLWAPLSEFYGRQIPFFFTYMVLTAFNAGAAGAQNMQTLIILRFFAGSFGSSPLTNSGGVIADMFTASERGLATAVFATAPFLGPSIGPIVGGFLGETEGWRWIEGVMAIFTGVLWIVCSMLVPETYAPVILRRRAAKLTKLTGKVHISKLELQHQKKTMAHQFKVALSRPWVLLFKEPIVFLTSLYMAIIYGTLYMMFAAFPIVFQQYRGWSQGIGGLAFLGVTVGMMVAVSFAIFDNKRYTAVVAKYKGAAPPEARLPPAIIGSILIPVGLFWFAWTNSPSIHWVVCIIGSGFFAAGIVLVFLSLMNYLIDSYVIFAASVLAANAVLRSLFGAAFPLFTTQMYGNLGIHWASSIPAFLALGCLPFPILFYKYGDRIRMRCEYAAEAALVLQRMRSAHQPQVQVEDIDTDEAEEEMHEVERQKTLERQRTRASRASRSSRRHSFASRVSRADRDERPPVADVEAGEKEEQ